MGFDPDAKAGVVRSGVVQSGVIQSGVAEVEDLSLSRVPTPPFACTQDRGPSSSASEGAACQQAHPDDGMLKERLGTMLEKALGDLTRSLPPGDAMEARKFLASVVGGSARQGQHHVELTKWLTQHLEQQQEVSMQRLAKYMGNTTAGAPGSSGGATAGTATGTAAPGLSAGMGPALQPGFSATMPSVLGRTAFQPAPTGCQPTMCPSALRTSPPALPQRWCVAPMEPVEGWSGLPDCGVPVPHMGETLRMHLRSLIKIDSGRILIVRKINRLGFASPDILRQHFSWYGEVERVLVAHSRVKSSAPLTQAGSQMASRLRPSGLGFIVMSKPEEAAAILAEGQEQVICGAFIRVQQFERRMSDADEGVEDQGTAGDQSPYGLQDA